MLKDTNDYPLSLARRMVRSSMFRSGQLDRLGKTWWKPTDTAPYIHELHRRTVTLFDGMPTAFADPCYNAIIGPETEQWSSVDERVTAIDDCWVEPNRCHIIGPDGRLVRQSLTHRFVPMFPSAIGYASRRPGTRIDEAIVYDGFNSTNYYHHLIDTLPTIDLWLERSGLSAELPLIVNRWVFDSRFFAHLRAKSSFFAGLNWRVQEPGEWLQVGRAYRLYSAPFERQALDRVRALYGKVSEPKGRRIFLSRDSAMFGRGISNEPEVAALLKANGFETVYAEHLTLEEQQRVFTETTHLVALQGMGLVQQMFMDPARGHVLEVMPSSRLQSEYYWQGWTLGMCFYDVQTGSALDRSGLYAVDVSKLEAGVMRMLEHPANSRRYGETLIAEWIAS